MIKIYIPNNNILERKYIIDILFGEFLGLDYKLIIDNGELKINDWIIELENANKLIVEDHFFNKYPNNLEYLKEENIPKTIEFGKNDFIVEDNIPIIYGSSAFSLLPSTLICGIDIFASSFFMLTRWEEYVNKNRDNHDRFPAYESLAYKNNFLDRPVVNEYVEMVKNMLLYLGLNQKPRIKNYQLILTHDVDEIVMWRSWKQIFRVALGDVVKRRNIKLAFSRIKEYILIQQGKIKDPFDTFDWLIDKSESIGVKSRFYFMSGGVTEFDNKYKIDDERTIKLINHIKKRGHIVGFHPSYNAYNDTIQFKKEKEALEKASKSKIREGREHYLRFEVPTTWQIWADNGLEVDSTCGYADKEGFRCGTGDEFSVFNILSREKLKLKERPLVYMDDSHYSYHKNIDTKKSFKIVESIIHRQKKYHSKTTLLFHNSIFANNFRVNFVTLYEQLLGPK